ncbi:hypothetical protein RJ640_021707 [Escallonia rubra]|uniref:AMP-dependent synthetase/ligase domain-containing protein n=1 Tax=Escallonia rubra TaxID=112253 RepID=A0AA88QKI8_9ASTE|nr:hypothetical protein RJ640_021707 [Escallonia rubra]
MEVRQVEVAEKKKSQEGHEIRIMKKFAVKVEDGREGRDGQPSLGPVYRNPLAEHAFPPYDPKLSTAWDIFRVSVERYPGNRMLGWREFVDGKFGPYVWKTYKEVYEEVLLVGSALRASGIEPGSRVGIYGSNCPQWIVAMEACSAHSLVCVPLYDTLVIVSFTSLTEEEKNKAATIGVKPYTWNEFLHMGTEYPSEPLSPEKCNICTIMYTSGTSGEPKGVILTHENIATYIRGVDLFMEQFEDKMTVNDVYISFLPLAHILDRMIEEYFFHKGASVGFYHGDMDALRDDLMELQPTFLAGVPRVLERMHEGVLKALEELNPRRRKIFDVLYKYKLHWMKLGYKQKNASPLADLLAFGKVKARLGGRLRLIVSGGAPLGSEVEEFLRVTSCAFVLQGYGLTETCGLATLGFPDEMGMLGTVGSAFVYTELRLEEVPEMGYNPLADPPRGEVCDIGEMLPDGVLRIIDRKKNLIKLSQGEYVAVEYLEKVYGITPIIWVYGDSFKSKLVAVVVPHEENTKRWALQNGHKGSFSELCTLNQLQDHILLELKSTAERNKLRGFEHVKGVILEPRPFDQEKDLVTPTLKKRRDKLRTCYKVFGEILVKDVTTWNAFILGYMDLGLTVEAQRAFEMMPEKNIISWTTLVNGYITNWKLDKARSVFDEMSNRNVVSWTAMIKGYVQHGRFLDALELFSVMLDSGTPPNHFTFSSVLDACAGCSSILVGSQVHSCILKSGIPLDVILLTSLIDMYAKCGDIEAAFCIFESMTKKNLVSWNSMIGGYARHGLATTALDEFESMTEGGVKPDHVTFINVLSACAHGGLVEEGERHFNSMGTKYGIQARREHYACMVDLYGRAGQLEKAEKLIEGMPFKPDEVVWGALLGACGLHSSLAVGEFAARGLQDLEQDHPAVYSMLSKIHGEKGVWSNVTETRKMMKANRAKKQKAGSWIESASDVS